MQNVVTPWKRTARRVFWLAWPVLLVLGPGLIVLNTLDLLRSEGQPVDLMRFSPAIDLVGEVQLGQRFVAPRAELHRIDVLMYGYFRHNTQPVTFHLRKAEFEQDEVTTTFNADEVWGWRWVPFRFGPLADSEGQTYYFFLESPTSTPGDALTMGGVAGDLYPNGTAMINGKSAFADAAFRTFYANVSLAEEVSALAHKITGAKPSIWGDVRLYVLLGALYSLLVLGLFWRLYSLHED
jgi:hypothetical protein